MDAVDQDAVFGDLVGEVLGDVGNGRIGHAVAVGQRTGRPRGHTADVDDAASAASLHVGDNFPGAPHVAHHLDVDVIEPVLVGQLHEWRGGGIHGVVDQDIHAPKLGHGGGHQVADVIEDAGIGADRHDPAACLGAYIRRRVLQVLHAAGADGDVHALLGQRQGRGASDALAAAGYDGDLPFQRKVHVSSLLFSGDLEIISKVPSPSGGRLGWGWTPPGN